MKKLTTEEKAKAYDFAVEEIGKLRDTLLKEGVIEEDGIINGNFERIFPELKEPDDERIRKAIVLFFELQDDNTTYSFIPKKDILAWLEKQGKNNMGISEATKQELKDNLNKALAKETPESWNEFLDEQKSVDKVEPKFHIGDWIIFNENQNSVYQVEKIDNCRYYLRHYLGGSFSVHFDNELIRAWTIQDAKDGDVLHSIGWHNDCIFIFNGLDKWRFDEPNGDRAVATGCCCLFVSVSADKMEFGIQGPDCIEVNTVKPATKEQRDLLFQKIKEAGYTFDFEKKELKKIEENPAWKPSDEQI